MRFRRGLALAWRAADIAEPEMARAPFFIEWSKTSAHPSTTSPKGCRLETLEFYDPKPAPLAQLVRELGLEVKVAERPDAGMVLTLECPKGRIVLGGR